MSLHLKKASVEDSERIHAMQIIGFKALLDKYKDYDTNPGAETIERVKARFAYDNIDHYIITLCGESIGYIRIVRLNDNIHRLSQMFILPNFQGNGYAQTAIKQAELFYPEANKWELDTIKQESKLCHLYEKMGYRLTGNEKNIKQDMDIVDYAK